MIEIDFEDFMEEVKFQMTEYEDLKEDMILDWEDRAREWMGQHKKNKKWVFKSKDDIILSVKNEDVMLEVAKKFHTAYRQDKLEEYWKKFFLF